jgi:tubulin--tyrosine ligase
LLALTSSDSVGPASCHRRVSHCLVSTRAPIRFEPTNELFYEEFDAELRARFPHLAAQAGGSVLRGVVLPQVKRMVVQCMVAARGSLQVASDYYSAFHLLGFDFLVDENLRVWLCEINASPAVADELLPGLISALIRTAVDPYCPPINGIVEQRASRRPVANRRPGDGAVVGAGGSFECLYRAPLNSEDQY